MDSCSSTYIHVRGRTSRTVIFLSTRMYENRGPMSSEGTCSYLEGICHVGGSVMPQAPDPSGGRRTTVGGRPLVAIPYSISFAECLAHPCCFNSDFTCWTTLIWTAAVTLIHPHLYHDQEQNGSSANCQSRLASAASRQVSGKGSCETSRQVRRRPWRTQQWGHISRGTEHEDERGMGFMMMFPSGGMRADEMMQIRTTMEKLLSGMRFLALCHP